MNFSLQTDLDAHIDAGTRTIAEIEEIGLFIRKRLFEGLPLTAPIVGRQLLMEAPRIIHELKPSAVPFSMGLFGEEVPLLTTTGGEWDNPFVSPTMTLASSSAWYTADDGGLYFLVSDRSYSGLLREDPWALWQILFDTSYVALDRSTPGSHPDILEHRFIPFGARLASGMLEGVAPHPSSQAAALAAAVAMPAEGIAELEEYGWATPMQLASIYHMPIPVARARLSSYVSNVALCANGAAIGSHI